MCIYSQFLQSKYKNLQNQIKVTQFLQIKLSKTFLKIRKLSSYSCELYYQKQLAKETNKYKIMIFVCWMLEPDVGTAGTK